MGQLVDRLGNKTEGQLVRSADWDALVAAVEQGDADLATQIAQAKQTIEQEIASVQSDLSTLESKVDALPLGSTTVHAGPADNLQAKLDALPADGGELSLAAGIYALTQPLQISQRKRVVISGAGAATILRVQSSETAVVFTGCSEVELRSLRVEVVGAPPAPRLGGAVTFLGASDVLVFDCTLVCPSAAGRGQTCLTMRPQAASDVLDGIRVEHSRFEIGARQVGILLVGVRQAVVAGNRLRIDPTAVAAWRASFPAPGPAATDAEPFAEQGIVVVPAPAGHVQVLDNVLEGVAQGIHVAASVRRAASKAPVNTDNTLVIARNAITSYVPGDYKKERHAVFVGSARSVQVLETTAALRNTVAVPTPVEGIRLYGSFGPYLLVRGSSLRGFPVGIKVEPLELPREPSWAVTDTQAEGAGTTVEAPDTVERQRNHPAPPSAPQPGRPTAVTLSPAVGVTQLGTQSRIVAMVRDVKGLAVPNQSVRFSLTGPNAAAVAPAAITTDGSGQAAFTYTGPNAGTDTIMAFVDLNGNAKQDLGEPFAGATQTLLAPVAASLTFATASVVATSGTQASLTAQVADGAGRPMKDVPVTFTVTGANSTPAAGPPVVTNASGQAVFAYTGANVGTDTVTASVTRADGSQLLVTATVSYVPPAVTRVVLAVGGGGGAEVGQTATFTATALSQAATTVAGVPLRFVVTGANHLAATVNTNAQGQAPFQYTGANPGTDTITAFVIKDPAHPEVQQPDAPFAVATFTFAVVPPALTLVPDLTDMTRAAAVTALASAGLVLGQVTTLQDPPRPVGAPLVVVQAPEALAQVVRGSRVDIKVQRPRGDILDKRDEPERRQPL